MGRYLMLMALPVLAFGNELTVVTVDVCPGVQERVACRIEVEHPQARLPLKPVIAGDGKSWAHGYLPPDTYLPGSQAWFVLETVCTGEDPDVACVHVQHTVEHLGVRCGGSRCFVEGTPPADSWVVCALTFDHGTFVCSDPWTP